jgi:hypothetical protein
VKHYDRLVPPDSFMGLYLQHMSTQESAYNFDWWCGMWCISAACGRSTWVDRPRAPVFMNMYIVLVGDSGVARKSTSVWTAKNVVRPVLAEHDYVAMLDAKMTPEALDALLHERSATHGSAQMCITIPELAVFLGTERYVATMPTLLTDLYDCPAIRHGGGTIERGECIQRNVWLSFLSASTPVWLLKAVNPNVVEGGFTSRCLFVIANEPKRSVPWPDADAPDHTDALVSELRRIRDHAKAHGGIQLAPDALNAFSRWYGNRPRALDAFKQSFEAREDAHVLRVAALLCINDGSWIVHRSHVNVAVQLVTELKENSGRIFESTATKTKYATTLDTVRNMLVSTGMDPVSRHKLYLKCRGHVSLDEFLSLIEVLHEIGAVQRFEVLNDAGMGRPTQYIRGTQVLLSRGLGEQVLERFV